MNNSATRLYHIWNGMRGRCLHESYSSYKRYGGRGIEVCKEWDDFSVFKAWALSHGYNDSLTIDRIDTKGNYDPNNCRWVTYKEQQNNKKNNRILTLNGESKTVSEWGDYLKIKPATLFTRLKRGWSIERTLTTPIKRKGGVYH